MVTLYGIKNCDTTRKARRWLEVNNIDYRFHNYRVDGLDSGLLDDFISELSQEALLNTRDTTWRKLDETTRNKITDTTSVAALVTEMPAVIKHPLLYVFGKPTLLNFSDSSYRQFFHEAQSASCPVTELIRQLTRRPSLSSDDTGCQALLIECLQAAGFTAERIDFTDTQNFWV